MTLIDQLASIGSDRKAQAAARYVELLDRADAPEPGDVESLEEALDVLGLTAGHFAEAIQIRHQIKQLRDGLPSEKEIARLAADVTKALEAVKTAEQQLTAARNAFNTAKHRSTAAQTRADNDRALAAKLDREHARILRPGEPVAAIPKPEAPVFTQTLGQTPLVERSRPMFTTV